NNNNNKNNNNEEMVKILCFSDTHERHIQFNVDNLPSADIVLHAGDFTMTGSRKAVRSFEEWGQLLLSVPSHQDANTMPTLPRKVIDNVDARKFKHLVCIAGNHEKTFEIDYFKQNSNDKSINPQEIKDIVSKSKHWIYLEDSMIELCGYKIYGTPWQPFFCNWAFNLHRGKPLQEKWKLIPKETDILLTHGPPLGHGDKIPLRYAMMGDGKCHVGCTDLLQHVLQYQPLLHIFGHIHDGYGATKQKDCQTLFVNASSVNEAYRLNHRPILICIPKKRNAK
ncbi:hypothetical protein RFI_23964, partial [Reticulomyxa filosa]